MTLREGASKGEEKGDLSTRPRFRRGRSRDSIMMLLRLASFVSGVPVSQVGGNL